MSRHEDLERADVEKKIHTLQTSEVDKGKSQLYDWVVLIPEEVDPRVHTYSRLKWMDPRYGLPNCKRQPLTALAAGSVLCMYTNRVNTALSTLIAERNKESNIQR
jgi:hypothetical protein